MSEIRGTVDHEFACAMARIYGDKPMSDPLSELERLTKAFETHSTEPGVPQTWAARTAATDLQDALWEHRDWLLSRAREAERLEQEKCQRETAFESLKKMASECAQIVRNSKDFSVPMERWRVEWRAFLLAGKAAHEACLSRDAAIDAARKGE